MSSKIKYLHGAPENEPHEEPPKKELPFGCRSRAASAAAILALICVVAAVVFNWSEISPLNLKKNTDFSDSHKEEASAMLTGSTVLERNFQSADQGLIYISDTSVIGLNHDCERVLAEKHSFTNPMLRSSGEFAIAFNEGGGNFKIISDYHKTFEGVQGTSITDCCINENGDYAILSDQTGYLSCLTVYDKMNNFVYSYSFSDVYAVTVTLSRDGKKAAVGTVNSLNGQLVSNVYLLDLSKQDPINIFTYQDQLIYEVSFISDDRLAVITDVLTSVIKSDGTKEVPYSYSSQILTAYDFCYDSGIVLSLSKSDDGRSCSVVTLNKDGGVVGSFDTDLKIISLDAVQDRTAVLSYGHLGIYNAYGNVFGEWDVGTDSKSVLLPHNKTVYLLSVSGVKKLSLKY